MALGDVTVLRWRHTIELDAVSDRQLDDAGLAGMQVDLQWLSLHATPPVCIAIIRDDVRQLAGRFIARVHARRQCP
ncbi:MAG TPA: hypothetical protein VF516_08280, partial [Kofleriaceae bacterium]